MYSSHLPPRSFITTASFTTLLFHYYQPPLFIIIIIELRRVIPQCRHASTRMNAPARSLAIKQTRGTRETRQNSTINDFTPTQPHFAMKRGLKNA